MEPANSKTLNAIESCEHNRRPDSSVEKVHEHLSHMSGPAWMSLWDKYFAPGDLRRQREQQRQAELQKLHGEVQKQQLAQQVSQPQRIDAAQRVRRQNAMLYGGALFSILSLVVTRRASARKKASMIPKTFEPSSSIAASEAGGGAFTGTRVDGSLDALQALNYATMNVFSFFTLGTGAFMTYFDVADVEDLRQMLRQSVGTDVYAGDSKADQEIEAWIAETLARKDGNGGLREGIAEKIAEVQQEAERKKRNGDGDGKR